MITAKTMKSISALAAAGVAMIGSQAAAQTATGQIGVTGFVASRCGAGGGAVPTGSTFNGTIGLGELANAEGSLRTALTTSTEGSPAGTISFGAGCTGTAATVRISATRFSTLNPVVGETAEVSFANDIDYTAQAAMSLTGGGITPLNYTTAATLPAASSLAITEPFSPVPGNFEIRVFAFRPETGNQAILVAGNYTATITVTITPS